MTNTPQRVGRMMGPFGIKGEIRVLFDYALSAEEIIDNKIPLIVEKNGKILNLKKVRLAPKGLAATFTEITDRNIAEEYPKSALCVDPQYLPEEPEEHMLLDDLVGFKVYNRLNQEVGEVTDTHNFGASDIFEIKHYETKKDVMIPDTEEVVLEVNYNEKTITVSDAMDKYLEM